MQWWIWVLILGVLFGDILLFAFDRYIWSFALLIISVGLAYFFVQDFSNLIHAIGWRRIFLVWVPLYLLAGILTAFLKWVLFNLEIASNIREVKEELTARENPGRRDQFINAWNLKHWDHSEKLSSSFRTDEELINALTPQAKKHVERISFWILQWPIVILSTLLDDFLRNLAKHVARAFDMLLNKLSRALIAKAVKGI